MALSVLTVLSACCVADQQASALDYSAICLGEINMPARFVSSGGLCMLAANLWVIVYEAMHQVNSAALGVSVHFSAFPVVNYPENY